LEEIQGLQSQITQIRTEINELREYKIKEEQKHDMHVYWARKWLKFSAKVISWAILIAFLLIELKKMDPTL
jgi:hypothetical protein